MLVEKGSVVRSMAGHDKGTLYLVLGAEKDRMLLCDGKRRPLDRPKRKSGKHIRKTNTVLDLAGMDTDKKVRRALSALAAKEGGNQLV